VLRYPTVNPTTPTPWISPPITEGNGAIPSWAPTTLARYLHLWRLLKKESSSICLETDKYLAEQEWTIPTVPNAPKMCRTQQVWKCKSFNIPYDYKERKPPYYFVNTRPYIIEYSCIKDGTVYQKNNKNDNIYMKIEGTGNTPNPPFLNMRMMKIDYLYINVHLSREVCRIVSHTYLRQSHIYILITSLTNHSFSPLMQQLLSHERRCKPVCSQRHHTTCKLRSASKRRRESLSQIWA
jgi:hypothetical protein